MRSHSSIEHGQTDPEASNTFSLERLCSWIVGYLNKAVNDSCVRELARGVRLHALEFGLDVIGRESCDRASDARSG